MSTNPQLDTEVASFWGVGLACVAKWRKHAPSWGVEPSTHTAFVEFLANCDLRSRPKGIGRATIEKAQAKALEMGIALAGDVGEDEAQELPDGSLFVLGYKVRIMPPPEAESLNVTERALLLKELTADALLKAGRVQDAGVLADEAASLRNKLAMIELRQKQLGVEVGETVGRETCAMIHRNAINNTIAGIAALRRRLAVRLVGLSVEEIAEALETELIGAALIEPLRQAVADNRDNLPGWYIKDLNENIAIYIEGGKIDAEPKKPAAKKRAAKVPRGTKRKKT